MIPDDIFVILVFVVGMFILNVLLNMFISWVNRPTPEELILIKQKERLKLLDGRKFPTYEERMEARRAAKEETKWK